MSEPDSDVDVDLELDYEAARIINGRLGGHPVGKSVDLDRIEAAVREILIAVGEDPDREGLLRGGSPAPTPSFSRAFGWTRRPC